MTDAEPHFLVADGALLSHRRTRAGDAAEAGTRPTTPGVLLGMPRIGAPLPPETTSRPDGPRSRAPASVDAALV